MNDFDRFILKGPNYIGPAQRIRPLLRRMPQLHELKLTQACAEVTCRICRGARRIVNEHSNGLMDYEPCAACRDPRTGRPTGLMPFNGPEMRR
jgi:hypothetical protein